MTAPVQTQSSDAELTMRFFLPHDFDLRNAPVPADPTVNVLILPAATLAVRRFSGPLTAAWLGIEPNQAVIEKYLVR